MPYTQGDSVLSLTRKHYFTRDEVVNALMIYASMNAVELNHCGRAQVFAFVASKPAFTWPDPTNLLIDGILELVLWQHGGRVLQQPVPQCVPRYIAESRQQFCKWLQGFWPRET